MDSDGLQWETIRWKKRRADKVISDPSLTQSQSLREADQVNSTCVLYDLFCGNPESATIGMVSKKQQ